MTSNGLYALAPKFQALFSGLPDAYGTGKGSWVRKPPSVDDFLSHLKGEGPGLGIAPLRRDGTVLFAAIDLDEPDFEAAREMQGYIPGPSYIERSRSGNAHVWVFFSEPVEAWIVRGILKAAILAAGKGAVEVFPKQDALLPDMVGNYINLPYFGASRPILWSESLPSAGHMSVDTFLDSVETNTPARWKERAGWLLLVPPGSREKSSNYDFGEQPELHMCAEWIVANRDENPVVEGHRNAVFFALAKQLSNYAGFDHDEVWSMILLVNEASPDPAPLSELRRILHNAERGHYTSTDCDNPLVQPYCHPNCPIAFPK